QLLDERGDLQAVLQDADLRQLRLTYGAAREGEAEGDDLRCSDGDVGQRNELNADGAGRRRRREERGGEQLTVFQLLDGESGGSTRCGPRADGKETLHGLAELSKEIGRLLLHGLPPSASTMGDQAVQRARCTRSRSGARGRASPGAWMTPRTERPHRPI